MSKPLTDTLIEREAVEAEKIADHNPPEKAIEVVFILIFGVFFIFMLQFIS